eukprot:7567190-Pyramimonas_sp.AAC.1
MDGPDFTEALRLRVGAAGPLDPVPCGLCCQAILDVAGSHALCCCRAESPRGHHAIARRVHAAARVCDPGAELEAPGL